MKRFVSKLRTIVIIAFILATYHFFLDDEDYLNYALWRVIQEQNCMLKQSLYSRVSFPRSAQSQY